MEWVALVFSGFVATIMAAAFFRLARSFHITTFSPTILLGCVVLPDPRRPHTDALGFVFLLLAGSSLGALIFRILLDSIGRADWVGGVVVGGVMGLLISLAAPLFGTISACVKAGLIPAPGRLGTGWGKATPGIILAGSMLYGGIFAAIHAGF
jgi:hypothetical protein